MLLVHADVLQKGHYLSSAVQQTSMPVLMQCGVALSIATVVAELP